MNDKTHILIAEDDENFGMMLRIYLEMNGYKVSLCKNGQLALSAFQTEQFDLCILDVMMPLLDGFTLAEKLVRSQKKTPFVFLTAKSLKEDQINGYKLGASDYLIKPFDPEILLLKLNLILQNSDRTTAVQKFQIGNFVFDYAKRLLTLQGIGQKLSPKEAELLKLLIEKRGEVLTHEEALMKIWKNDDFFTKQSMNVFITKLRKYLHKDIEYNIQIENLHSTGFVLSCHKNEL